MSEDINIATIRGRATADASVKHLCEQEAADVLFVLLSTMEAHGIGVDWVLEILEQRLEAGK